MSYKKSNRQGKQKIKRRWKDNGVFECSTPERQHCATRLKQRYGLRYTKKLYTDILSKIGAGQFLYYNGESRTRREVLLYCQGTFFRLIYKKGVGPITFLPLKPEEKNI